MLYQNLARPLLFLTPPEWIHHVSLFALAHTPLPLLLQPFTAAPRHPSLERRLFGLTFPNPIGVAAGFDKNGEAPLAWQRLGFGYMELGTITPKGQPGNPTPRVFRLKPESGLINRLGFPNHGADTIAQRLMEFKDRGLWPTVPVGLNIGKNKDTPLAEAGSDYLACFQILRGLGDYFVVNISSPNTPGLRDLQQPEFLASILKPLRHDDPECKVPLLLKVAPDLTERELGPIIAAAFEFKLSGIIATNTTIDKTGLSSQEQGGASGKPLTKKSTEIIRIIHRMTEGKLPIIGVGGIFTADDAKEKFDAGAQLLQIYTGFVYQGPTIVRDICKGLISL